MKTAIVISKVEDVDLSLAPEALTLKTAALEKAAEIVEVTDASTLEVASASLRDLESLARQMEKGRKEVKEPVLALGRKIDEIARGFTAALAAETDRIKRLIADHTRRERERQEGIRRMQEAAARRKQEEAEREAREATARAREASDAAEAERLQREAEERALAAQQAAVRQTQIATAVPVAPRAEGVSTRVVWKHEVQDLAALYAARPDLVTLEPKTQAINEAIRSGLRDLPGVRIYQDEQVVARSR